MDMNEITVFSNKEFGDVRTVLIDGETWFVRNDIAKALGYAKPSQAVIDHCKRSAKHGIRVSTGTKYITAKGKETFRLLIGAKL